MKKNRKSYEKENFEIIIKESLTLRDVILKLGLVPAGGNYATVNKYINKYNIDISHFISSESRIIGLTKHIDEIRIPIEEILVENSTYNRGHLKRRLYKLGLKKRECELCGQGEIWRGNKMSLILDHKNGVNDDNRLENIQIVCPNCNATLDTHCGKNNKKNILTEEEITNKIKEKEINYYNTALRKRTVERPPYEDLKKEVWSNGYSATGRKYGVSDNAIRKWIKYYENHELKLKEENII